MRDVEPYERLGFHLLALKLDVEVRLEATAAERTRVTVRTSRGAADLPRIAVRHLYDLVQTAASL